MEQLAFLNDKQLKPKVKTEILSQLLVNKEISTEQWMEFAGSAKEAVKATCIEAMEFASKEKPEIVNLECLNFVAVCLTEKAPRIKWESARVIGNIAHIFPDKLDIAVKNLLTNTAHPGTVVRWSAAFALSQIIKLKTAMNKNLTPAVKMIIEKEEKNSIKKIYLDALKKAEK